MKIINKNLTAIPLAITELPGYDNTNVVHRNYWYGLPIYQSEQNSVTTQWRWEECSSQTALYHLSLSSGEKKLHILINRDRNTLSSTHLDWTQYKGSAQIIAWSIVYDTFIKQLDSIFQETWTLDKIPQSSDGTMNSKLSIGFTFNSVDNDDIAMSGEIIMPQELARQIKKENFIHNAGDHQYSSLPFAVNASMRPILLSHAELEKITLGAIICLPATYLQQQSLQLHLTIGHYCITALCLDFSIKVTTINLKKRTNYYKDTSMNEDTLRTPSTDRTLPNGKTSIKSDELNITLRLEVAQLSLSLAELKNLQPGFIFNLDQPLTETSITLYANEQKIGTGQLVHVGDSMGVKVTTLTAR